MRRRPVLPVARCARALLLILVCGCTPADTRGPGLYAALGGEEGIRAITDRFLFELADNQRALPLFANTDIERFRDQFATQLCSVSGGPCEYEGDSMRDTHRGMDIDRGLFNSVVDDLIAAMEFNAVPVAAQNALLARLVPMFDDITGR